MSCSSRAPAVLALLSALLMPLAGRCETGPVAAGDSPGWFASVQEQALRIAVPDTTATALAAPKPPGELPPILLRIRYDPDASGALGTFQPAGPTRTDTEPFFQALGSNGRSCASCHRIADGLGLGTATLRQLHERDGDRDPVFAAVDGADCPSRPHRHSLLLSRGLFRIFLPVPADADYTVAVLHDPNGCNTLPAYTAGKDFRTGRPARMLSVYRRPLASSNLRFVTATHGDADPLTGDKMPIDPATGNPVGGNIMSDGREPTLESQALHATLGHAQARTLPTAAQVARIVAFERRLFSAQAVDRGAGILNQRGGKGGPFALSAQPLDPAASDEFSLYAAWSWSAGQGGDGREGRDARASIARGEAIFNTRRFVIDDVAGLNNLPHLPRALQGTCAGCHAANYAGGPAFPAAQRAIGVGGDQPRLGGPAPASDLPIFKITCKPGAATAFGLTSYVTNDPGKALITGRCADVGRATIPPLRALAARAPYFSNGSAATLDEVVGFYNRRFGIGLSQQDRDDLVHFLASL